MENFTKVVRIGTFLGSRYSRYSVYCQIKFIDGRLSISGVEGPTRGGNARGSSGQIADVIREELSFSEGESINFAIGWDAATLTKFLDIWDRWHLNDMRAGSPAQTEWLRANPQANRQYEEACAQLEAAGLNPDPNCIHEGKPCAYGTTWLREDVPEDTLTFLRSLPDTDQKPDWV